MKTILIFLALIICGALLLFAFRKLLESIYNFKILIEENNNPGSKPRNKLGFVINKKSHRIEADSHIKLPF